MLASICRAGPSRLPISCRAPPLSSRPFWQNPTATSASRSISTLTNSSSPRTRFLPPYLRVYSSRRTSASTSTAPPNPAIASTLTQPNSPLPPLPPTSLDRFLPKWAEPAKPYILLTRFDKPIGSALLYWPCAWSITMAASVNHLPLSTPLWYMSLFAVGAVIMRGAGCTINDMWDRKYDAAVERTRHRPIARGDVTQFQALCFLGVQLSAGFAVLTQLNWYSIVLGASSLGLVVIYPFMKRITYFPQIVFGMTFSWGTLLGWSAVAGAVNWPIVIPMYIGKVCWGIAYDTIYAHQDKKDDILVGVKSTALAFPDSSRPFIITLNTSFLTLMSLSGYLAGLGPLYYLISIGGGATHLAWQCLTVNFDDRGDCWKKFVSNGYLGGLIWLGIFMDYVWRVVLGEEVEDEKQEEKVLLVQG